MNSLSHAKTQRRKEQRMKIIAPLLFRMNRYYTREGPCPETTATQRGVVWRHCVRMKLFLIAPAFLLLAGCSQDPGTGPVEVTWDRDSCERCVMALSDRHHAAQIRGGENNRVHTFDDIGCALLWLEEQPWRDEPETEIWVNDYRSGEWLNARTAHYVKVTHTPMNYGFSAQPAPSEGSVGFDAAKQAIFKQESTYQASAKARIAHRHEEANSNTLEHKQ